MAACLDDGIFEYDYYYPPYSFHLIFSIGPDWEWENQDGGEGNIGSVYRVTNNATVNVCSHIVLPFLEIPENIYPTKSIICSWFCFEIELISI
jgi:hypothetical protein